MMQRTLYSQQTQTDFGVEDVIRHLKEKLHQSRSQNVELRAVQKQMAKKVKNFKAEKAALNRQAETTEKQ